MKPNSIDRLASLSLTTAIHAAAGLALFLIPPPGGSRHGNAMEDRNGVLVVELIPLDQGTAASTTLAPEKQENRAAPQPSTSYARQVDSRALAASDVSGQDNLANFGSPSPPAQAGSSASALEGTSAMTYRNLLLAHIARYRRYPADAHRDGLEGTVEVGFTLKRDGSIGEAWIVTSSGRQMFDREAMAAIHRAVPMPAIPADLPSSIDISLPIDFEIE